MRPAPRSALPYVPFRLLGSSRLPASRSRILLTPIRPRVLRLPSTHYRLTRGAADLTD